MESMLNESQRALKEKFIRERGYWSTDIWEGVLQLDPKFLEAYLDFSAVPFKNSHLQLKDKELIYIAFDVSATHLYKPGTRVHMQNALKYGATHEEIMEVIELASLLGIHAATVATPILMQELERHGCPVDTELTARQEELKQNFIEERGYWSETWDGLLLLAPDLFEKYLAFSAVPFSSSCLEPKMKELICIAVNAAATHLHEPGIRLHIRNALKYGASKEEIVEVLALTSTLGIHAATVSVPILLGLDSDSLSKSNG